MMLLAILKWLRALVFGWPTEQSEPPYTPYASWHDWDTHNARPLFGTPAYDALQRLLAQEDMDRVGGGCGEAHFYYSSPDQHVIYQVLAVPSYLLTDPENINRALADSEMRALRQAIKKRTGA